MASGETRDLDHEATGWLTPAERGELQTQQYVKTGEWLVWLEPEGVVRREKISSLYYIRTARGVFRISRISNEVVEV